MGNSVSVNYEWPNIGTVLYPGGTHTITSGGTTFSMDSGGVTADVTNSSIVITFPGWLFSTAPKSFDGIVVADPSADITGVTLASTNITGFIASDLSFNSHDVFVNFPYPPFASLPAGATLTVDVLFAAPEPASLALLGAGLLGIAVLNRRKFRR